jgi:ubiquitin carboxyl-terminal hydrolase L3
MTDIVYKWPALESDPSIFNKYFHDLGLPDNIVFDELYSLDYQDVQSELKDLPILAIIATVQRPKGRYCQEDNLIPYHDIPFYMKQSRDLDNACGLIAGLHAIGNNKEITLKEGILKRFFKLTDTMNDEERATFLENYKELKTKHLIYSQIGQSQLDTINNTNHTGTVSRPVIHHFLTFTRIGNDLLELDGTLKGPVIIKKDIHENELLDSTILEIRKRIDMGVIGEDISVIFMTYA